MSTRTDSNRSAMAGYAVGVGLVFIPLIGVPVRFMFQGLPPPLVYGCAFLLGVVAALLLASVRRGRRSG